MSVKVDIDVIGLKELEAALKDLGSEVAGKNGGLIRSALMSASLPVLRDAQSRVPVDEGDLRKSIKRSRVPNPKSYSELITVGFPLPQWAPGQHAKLLNKEKGGHGRFVELGTSKMAARPFLRPALEGNRQNSVEIFRQKLAAGIERVAKKIGNKNAQAVGARIKKL